MWPRARWQVLRLPERLAVALPLLVSGPLGDWDDPDSGESESKRERTGGFVKVGEREEGGK